MKTQKMQIEIKAEFLPQDFMDGIVNAAKTLLIDELEKGTSGGYLIEIPFRGIGKTTALIEFAMKHNFAVVVNSSIAKHLAEEFSYPKIYSVNDIDLLRQNKVYRVVVDEHVKKEVLIEKGISIITGFHHNEFF